MALTKVTGQVIKNTTDVTVGVLTVTNTLAVGGTVSVGGTLTYEDVTNVDSVGLITARNGIVVGGGITLSKDGDIFATGITTISGNVKVGTGITLSPDGDAFFTGVTTATKFVGANAEVSGDLSGATGTFTGDVRIADKIIHTGDTNTAIRFPEADTFSVETSGTQRLRVEAAGNVNFANSVNVSGTSTVTGIAQFANTINLTHASAGQNYIYFNEDLQLAKNGTGTRLKINSSGSVGIGTVTVSGAKLDVIDGIINVGAAVTTNDSRIQFTRKDTGIYSWVGIPNWNPNALYIYGPKDSNPYNEAAALYESSTWQLLTSGTARVQINPTGSLNIRNTSGYDTYDVDISNAATTDTSVQIRPNDGNAGEAQLYIGGGGTNQNKCAIIFDPAGGYCRGNLHFCMDNTGDTSNVDSSDKKLSISPQGYITAPQQPYVMLGITANQAVGQSSTKEVIWDSVMYDTASGYDSSTGRYTCPVIGDYLITFDCQYTGVVNAFHLGVGVNGTNPPGGTNFDLWNHTGDNVRGDNIARVIRITATTQYISFFTYTTSGGNLEPNRTKATIKFLG